MADGLHGVPPRSDASAEAERPWLTPTEALSRFAPPQGGLVRGAGSDVGGLRYGVRVGSLGLLIHPDAGSEVIPIGQIAPLPLSPSWMRGMINLRGNLLPVFDLRRALHLEHGVETGRPLVLVLDKGDKAVGVIIDGFPRPLRGLTPVSSFPALHELLAPHVPAVLASGEDEVWLEFDHGEFFISLQEANTKLVTLRDRPIERSE